MAYKTYECIRRITISTGQNITDIKRDEINIMDIIKDNTFYLHNSLLDNNNR